MPKFPVDAPKGRVLRALEQLGFRLIREREHIVMSRQLPDGKHRIAVLPNHARIKGPTLRDICTEAEITREEFLTRHSRNQTRPNFKKLEALAKCVRRPVDIGRKAPREKFPATKGINLIP